MNTAQVWYCTTYEYYNHVQVLLYHTIVPVRVYRNG